MVRFLACLSLLLLLVPGTFLRDPPRPPDRSQAIAWRAVPLDPRRPSLRRIGALQFAEAWEMRSRNDAFGGWSGMVPRPAGGFLAVSDAGELMGFTPPSMAVRARDFIAPLPGGTGPLGKLSSDAEALAVDPASGRFWVAFEQGVGIARFGPSFARLERRRLPPAMAAWDGNSGAEAMTRLPDGRFVVIAESGEGWPDGVKSGLVFAGDPAAGARAWRFGYRPPAGFSATDMAVVPGSDGRRLLVLNRSYGLEGFRARLVLLDMAGVRPDRIVTGRMLAAIDPPLTVDNMEGLAVLPRAAEPGALDIWMLSDDNFSVFQRTLLMRFVWRPVRTGANR